MNKLRRHRTLLGVAGVLLSLQMGTSAHARACAASASHGHEITPTARLLIAIPSALKAANPRAATVRGLGVPCERGVFSASGQTFTVTGEGSEAAGVRRAVSSADAKAALLIPFKKAEIVKPDAAHGEKSDTTTYYALATISGARVKVWRLFDAIPEDSQLQTAMSDGLWEIGRPLMSFSLDFKGPKSGPETLKDSD